MNENNNGMSRRDFLSRLGMLGAFALAFPASLRAEIRQQQLSESSPVWLSESQWMTIAQVQDVLFPADADTPGARDIRAVYYLHQVLDTPGNEDKDFIFRGVTWLNDLSRERHQHDFVDLDYALKEQLIQTISQSRAGRNWLSSLLTYIIQALVTDPVYGGNPQGVGWKWLQHQPGFPTPNKQQTWVQLQQRRYKA